MRVNRFAFPNRCLTKKNAEKKMQRAQRVFVLFVNFFVHFVVSFIFFRMLCRL